MLSPPFPPAPKNSKKHFLTIIVIVLFLTGLILGGFIGYAITYKNFNDKLTNVEARLNAPQTYAESFVPNATFVLGYNASLSTLYQQVKSSVVVIQNLVPRYNLFGNIAGYSQQQGSGFITKVDNKLVIVTNDHVIQDSINQTVTFVDGKSYPAIVLGSDPLADLAALSIIDMPSGLKPLTLASSDNLEVGEPVVAVGSPYGLSGTLTTGVISSLGRTITEGSSSGESDLTIPDVIQTSTAINPGNSGGPLLNYAGYVVGITTAGISNSEGLGFAVPSDTIMRELGSLVTSGTYDQHPTVGAAGRDMNYQIAQAMGTSVTYGFLVESVSLQNGLKGGNIQKSILGSTVILGGDIIIAINGQRITNTDDLLSYLEQHTEPGQTASFSIVRNSQTQSITVSIGKLS
jgi:S1-C subfamily serine protease